MKCFCRLGNSFLAHYLIEDHILITKQLDKPCEFFFVSID